MRRFLKHWQPDLALWIESELWPNMLCELRAQSVPAALLNARMSPTSFRRWRRFPRFARRLLGSFEVTLAQDAEHAARFRMLGADPVRIPGNLKFAAPPLGADEAALEAVLDAVADRPVWLAASTHSGEEAAAAYVHEALRHGHAGVLTILAPRHPDRGDEIETLLSAKNGLAVARRSRGELPGAATEVYLVDTLDELGLFLPGGGGGVHRWLPGAARGTEPRSSRRGWARLWCMGRPCSTSPKSWPNWRRRAARAGVADRDELAAAIGLLLSDSDARRTQAARAAAGRQCPAAACSTRWSIRSRRCSPVSDRAPARLLERCGRAGGPASRPSRLALCAARTARTRQGATGARAGRVHRQCGAGRGRQDAGRARRRRAPRRFGPPPAFPLARPWRPAARPGAGRSGGARRRRCRRRAAAALPRRAGLGCAQPSRRSETGRGRGRRQHRRDGRRFPERKPRQGRFHSGGRRGGRIRQRARLSGRSPARAGNGGPCARRRAPRSSAAWNAPCRTACPASRRA